MPTLLRWLVLTLWAFWGVVYWRGGVLVAAGICQSMRRQTARLDTAMMIAVPALTVALCGSGLAVTLGWVRIAAPMQRSAFVAVGTALAAAGFAGTFLCRRQLGRFWAAATIINEGHVVVDSGPYAWVRHPIYAAALLIYLGTALTFATWWNLSIAAAVAVAYISKTRYEDAFLAIHLPGYQAYTERVRYRLLPAVW